MNDSELVAGWKVTVLGEGFYYTRNWSDVEEERHVMSEEFGEDPSRVVVRQVVLTAEQWDALPEFQGF